MNPKELNLEISRIKPELKGIRFTELIIFLKTLIIKQ